MQVNTHVAMKSTVLHVNAHVARKPTALPYPAGVANAKDLRHYFEYSSSGVEVVEDGLQEVTFGEYLVQHEIVDRYQLFRALQMQDRLPGVRLGECVAALGYAPIATIERLYREFTQLHTVMV